MNKEITFCFGGYAQSFSGLTFRSVLGDHSWKCLDTLELSKFKLGRAAIKASAQTLIFLSHLQLSVMEILNIHKAK